MFKDVLDIIQKKERPTISKLIYILIGTIILIEMFLQILSLKVKVPFLENFILTNKINDNSLILNILLLGWVIYIISVIIRKLIICCSSKKSDDEFGKICITVYSVCDVLDLVVSIFSLAFIACVVIQIHKTDFVLLTRKAIFIYAMIMLQFFDFVIFRIIYKNKKVIYDSLNK